MTANSDIDLTQALALVDPLTRIAADAAMTIRAASHATIARRVKPDGTAVSAADEAAEAVILAGLARAMPGVPIVSEERVTREAPPALGTTFVLVDPLDGTREFLAGTDEFTVNIALISGGRPIAGVVAAPARNLLWRGAGSRAERLRLDGSEARDPQPVRCRRWPQHEAVAAVSRSHFDAATNDFLGALPPLRRVAAGSALKFCLIAEGSADVYPRLSPTSEWDVAAGHAVLAAAGGTVTTLQGQPLRYGNAADNFRVPGFIAWGDPARAQR